MVPDVIHRASNVWFCLVTMTEPRLAARRLDGSDPPGGDDVGDRTGSSIIGKWWAPSTKNSHAAGKRVDQEAGKPPFTVGLARPKTSSTGRWARVVRRAVSTERRKAWSAPASASRAVARRPTPEWIDIIDHSVASAPTTQIGGNSGFDDVDVATGRFDEAGHVAEVVADDQVVIRPARSTLFSGQPDGVRPLLVAHRARPALHLRPAPGDQDRGGLSPDVEAVPRIEA